MRSKRSVCLMKSGCLGWSTLIGRRKFKARELNRRRAKPTPPALFMLLECDIVGRRGTGSRRVKLDEKWNFSSSFSPSSLLPLLSFPFSRKERSTAPKKNARNTLVYLFFFFFKYQGRILFTRFLRFSVFFSVNWIRRWEFINYYS